MKNFLTFNTIDKVIYVINCILIGIGLRVIQLGILHFMGREVFTPFTVSVLSVSYGVILVFESVYAILRLFKLNKNKSRDWIEWLEAKKINYKVREGVKWVIFRNICM